MIVMILPFFYKFMLKLYKLLYWIYLHLENYFLIRLLHKQLFAFSAIIWIGDNYEVSI